MKLRNTLLFMLLAWFFMIIQTTLLNYLTFDGAKADLIFLLTVYISTKHRGNDAPLLALWNGYLLDLYAASPLGCHMLMHVLIYYNVQLLEQIVYVRGNMFHVISSTFIVEFFILFYSINQGHVVYYSLFVLDTIDQLVLNSLFMLPVFYITALIDRYFPREERLPGELELSF